jgi:hypothetical protein
MPETESGYKWWIRYVLIPLIGGGGLVALVVALISKTGTQGLQQGEQEPPKPPAVVRSNTTADVEKLVGAWVGAWMQGRTDEFVNLASVPFYFDQKVILTKPELRTAYQSLLQEKGATWREMEIQSIKVKTARELQGSGYDLSKDRIFAGLNLTQDDYTAVVTAKYKGRSESMIVVVRRVGSGYEIAGTWD